MSFWVYILRCADASYYTGHTDNLEKRIGEHTAGAIASCYTFKRRPVQLVFSQDFTTREEALASEQQIKGWSRKKKEAMMRGDWAEVSRLAKSSNAVRAEPVVRLLDRLAAHHDRETTTVRPELSIAVRPELVEGTNDAQNRHVEGQSPSVHPSTARQAHSSGRTEGEVPQ